MHSKCSSRFVDRRVDDLYSSSAHTPSQAPTEVSCNSYLINRKVPSSRFVKGCLLSSRVLYTGIDLNTTWIYAVVNLVSYNEDATRRL